MDDGSRLLESQSEVNVSGQPLLKATIDVGVEWTRQIRVVQRSQEGRVAVGNQLQRH